MRYFVLLLACVIAVKAHHSSNENDSVVNNLLVKLIKFVKFNFLIFGNSLINVLI